jgi:hypothetical protein
MMILRIDLRREMDIDNLLVVVFLGEIAAFQKERVTPAPSRKGNHPRVANPQT